MPENLHSSLLSLNCSLGSPDISRLNLGLHLIASAHGAIMLFAGERFEALVRDVFSKT